MKQVRCIDNFGTHLVEGKVYTVKNITGGYYTLQGVMGDYRATRFENAMIEKVKCIDNDEAEDDLKLGQIYEVEERRTNELKLVGISIWWSSERFEEVKDSLIESNIKITVVKNRDPIPVVEPPIDWDAYNGFKPKKKMTFI